MASKYGITECGVGTNSPSKALHVVADATNPVLINRTTSDGAVIDLQKDGVSKGTIGTTTNDIYLSNGVNTVNVSTLATIVAGAGVDVWATVTVTGGVPALTADNGVASITDLGTGWFAIYFDAARSSGNYAATGSLNAAGSVAFPNNSTTFAEIYTYNSSGTLTDFSKFHVMIAGEA